ncbi:MAG: hypothetical protein QW607_11310 [Desulfurococcaceae archaeon]
MPYSTSPRRIVYVSCILSKAEEKLTRIPDYDPSIHDNIYRQIFEGNYPLQVAKSAYSFMTSYKKIINFVDKLANEFVSNGRIIGEDLSSDSDEKIKEMATSLHFYLNSKNFQLSIDRLPLYLALMIGMYYIIGQLKERNLMDSIKKITASLNALMLAKRGNVDELVQIMEKLKANAFEKALEEYAIEVLTKGKEIDYEEIKKLYISSGEAGEEYFQLLNKAQSLELGYICFISDALTKLTEAIIEKGIDERAIKFADCVKKGYLTFNDEVKQLGDKI